MDKENHYKEWEKDFVEFLNAPEISPPPDVSLSIKNTIALQLNPSSFIVFTKLVVIVLFAGSASLLICPQLGFGKDIGLMQFFMSFGPVGCRAACGGFFMVCSVVSACFILRPEELAVVRRTKFLYISAISALALGAFLCASPDVILSAALIWFIGASLAGILSLEAGYRTKVWLLTHRYACVT